MNVLKLLLAACVGILILFILTIVAYFKIDREYRAINPDGILYKEIGDTGFYIFNNGRVRRRRVVYSTDIKNSRIIYIAAGMDDVYWNDDYIIIKGEGERDTLYTGCEFCIVDRNAYPPEKPKPDEVEEFVRFRTDPETKQYYVVTYPVKKEDIPVPLITRFRNETDYMRARDSLGIDESKMQHLNKTALKI